MHSVVVDPAQCLYFKPVNGSWALLFVTPSASVDIISFPPNLCPSSRWSARSELPDEYDVCSLVVDNIDNEDDGDGEICAPCSASAP